MTEFVVRHVVALSAETSVVIDNWVDRVERAVSLLIERAVEVGQPVRRSPDLSDAEREALSWFGPSRDVALRILYPEGLSHDFIISKLHTLPGYRTLTPDMVNKRAMELGLARPRGWNEATQTIVDDASPDRVRTEPGGAPIAQNADTISTAAAASASEPPPALLWSAARDKFLATHFPGGLNVVSILHGLRALPGAWLTLEDVYGRVRYLNLHRRGAAPDAAVPATEKMPPDPILTKELPGVGHAAEPAAAAADQAASPEKMSADPISTNPDAARVPTNVGSVRVKIRTEARLAALREMVALGRTDAAIADRLNRMPGTTISPVGVAVWISDLGLERPPADTAATTQVSRPKARPNPADQVGTPAPRPELPTWTNIRDHTLTVMAQQGKTAAQIQTALNAQTGATLTVKMIEDHAIELGVEMGAPLAAGTPAGAWPYSPARLVVLRESFSRGEPIRNIVGKLNVFDGDELDEATVTEWIEKLGLTRVVETNLGAKMVKTLPKAKKDWNTAVAWAEGQNVDFPEGCSELRAHDVINAARRELGLAEWEITPSNRKHVPVPKPRRR